MTRKEALAEAECKQFAQPEATWVAVPRGEDWVVARVGVGSAPRERVATIKPPPVTPHEAPQSPGERAVTQFGAGG
jgi:hypothetical protein